MILRLAFAATLLVLDGCINLPPALEHELECPVAGEPDNFGATETCSPASQRSR